MWSIFAFISTSEVTQKLAQMAEKKALMANLASTFRARKQFAFLLSNTLPAIDQPPVTRTLFCHCGKHITELNDPSYLG